MAREAAALQLTSSRRVRSAGRVAAGSAIAVGGLVAIVMGIGCAAVGPDAQLYSPAITASYDNDRQECVLDSRLDRDASRVYAETDYDAKLLAAGAGAVTVGALLALVWSDVDANDSLVVHTGPGRVAIGKRISW